MRGASLGSGVMKRAEQIGIIYKDGEPDAEAMTAVIKERFNLEAKSWVSSTAEIEVDMPQAKDTDLIITVGGDGTIIRATRLAISHKIPILGINMGRLGFMTELKANEALDKLPQYLEGNAWVEERCMLQTNAGVGNADHGQKYILGEDSVSFHALNEVVVGRGAVSRLVKVSAIIDGAHLTDFRADAVIVSTATGSTGYNLAVGGPILTPQAGEIILKAVAPHVGMAPALVLSPNSVIELAVETDHQAMLSVDGYLNLELSQGDVIRVEKSQYTALFVRANPPTHFYETLTQRLGFGGGQSTTRAIQY